jgi:hypothetical protein
MRRPASLRRKQTVRGRKGRAEVDVEDEEEMKQPRLQRMAL